MMRGRNITDRVIDLALANFERCIVKAARAARDMSPSEKLEKQVLLRPEIQRQVRALLAGEEVKTVPLSRRIAAFQLYKAFFEFVRKS